jgi:hypothetical protein
MIMIMNFYSGREDSPWLEYAVRITSPLKKELLSHQNANATLTHCHSLNNCVSSQQFPSDAKSERQILPHCLGFYPDTTHNVWSDGRVWQNTKHMQTLNVPWGFVVKFALC